MHNFKLEQGSVNSLNKKDMNEASIIEGWGLEQNNTLNYQDHDDLFEIKGLEPRESQKSIVDVNKHKEIYNNHRKNVVSDLKSYLRPFKKGYKLHLSSESSANKKSDKNRLRKSLHESQPNHFKNTKKVNRNMDPKISRFQSVSFNENSSVNKSNNYTYNDMVKGNIQASTRLLMNQKELISKGYILEEFCNKTVDSDHKVILIKNKQSNGTTNKDSNNKKKYINAISGITDNKELKDKIISKTFIT